MVRDPGAVGRHVWYRGSGGLGFVDATAKRWGRYYSSSIAQCNSNTNKVPVLKVGLTQSGPHVVVVTGEAPALAAARCLHPTPLNAPVLQPFARGPRVGAGVDDVVHVWGAGGRGRGERRGQQLVAIVDRGCPGTVRVPCSKVFGLYDRKVIANGAGRESPCAG